MQQIYDKLLIIGNVLGLSKQESKVFACKAMGMEYEKIAQTINTTAHNVGDCSTRIYRKLNISDDNNRNGEIQKLAQVWLSSQNYQLAEAISTGNAHKMTDILSQNNITFDLLQSYNQSNQH